MLKGGIADKLGNDYEALWTLVEALHVLRGEADEIRIEPFNEDAKALNSVSRRVDATPGTLSAFMRKLADPANDCVFVSSDSAPDLKTLSGKAAIVNSSSRFLDSLSKEDELNLQKLAKAWPVDQGTLFNWLRRVRVETTSETSLQRELTTLCGLLFTVEPKASMKQLAGYLDDAVTRIVTTESFVRLLTRLGLGWQARFWAASIAAGYHRLLKPRTCSSTGMTSTMRSTRRRRQSGASGVAYSASPSARSRSESAAYFA